MPSNFFWLICMCFSRQFTHIYFNFPCILVGIHLWFQHFEFHFLIFVLKLLRCCFGFSFSLIKVTTNKLSLNVLINFEFSSGTLFNLNCIKLWTNQNIKWLIKEKNTKKHPPRKFPSTPNWKTSRKLFCTVFTTHTLITHNKAPPPRIRPWEQSIFCGFIKKQTSQSRAKLRKASLYF